jgi:hypothetical protein
VLADEQTSGGLAAPEEEKSDEPKPLGDSPAASDTTSRGEGGAGETAGSPSGEAPKAPKAAKGLRYDAGRAPADTGLVLDCVRHLCGDRCSAGLAVDLGAAGSLQDAAGLVSFPLALLILMVLGSIVFGLATRPRRPPSARLADAFSR